MEGKLGGAAAGGVAASLRGRPPSGRYWTFGFDERLPRDDRRCHRVRSPSPSIRLPGLYPFLLTFSAGYLHYEEYDSVW